MAKVKKLAVVAAPPPEEMDEPECPKCPPKGAPAWMATFADMATLLMAFFVLILSFAEFDQPRFKMLAGSLREQFGVQSEVPSFELPMGTTMLSPNFSPSPDPSVIDEITQQTTQTQEPELDVRADEEQVDAEANQRAEQMAQALNDALADTAVTAEAQDGVVTLSFPQGADSAEMNQMLAQASAALQDVQAQMQAENPDAALPDVVLAGMAQQMQALAQNDAANGADGDGNGGEGDQGQRAAGLADARLQVALREEIAQGLVDVEQREDSVFITVGAGGSFASGSADLTPEAREIMARIAFTAMGGESRIEVTGHTDDRQLNPDSPFRDNWGLAAARAASVVREIGATGVIDASRMSAMSRGESQPIETNATPEGRARNRRIEIEITY